MSLANMLLTPVPLLRSLNWVKPCPRPWPRRDAQRRSWTLPLRPSETWVVSHSFVNYYMCTYPPTNKPTQRVCLDVGDFCNRRFNAGDGANGRGWGNRCASGSHLRRWHRHGDTPPSLLTWTTSQRSFLTVSTHTPLNYFNTSSWSVFRSSSILFIIT